jgi:hypothetical protein
MAKCLATMNRKAALPVRNGTAGLMACLVVDCEVSILIACFQIYTHMDAIRPNDHISLNRAPIF